MIPLAFAIIVAVILCVAERHVPEWVEELLIGKEVR